MESLFRKVVNVVVLKLKAGQVLHSCEHFFMGELEVISLELTEETNVIIMVMVLLFSNVFVLDFGHFQRSNTL